MRSLTKWFLLILCLELIMYMPGYADPIPIGIGGGIGPPYEKDITGVVNAASDIFPVKTVDSNYNATDWDLAHPEDCWLGLTGQMPKVTDHDCFSIDLDIPMILKNIKEVGLTTINDQKLMDTSNSWPASPVPAKGWRVLFKPGQLPLGMDKLYGYARHHDDIGGIPVFFFQIKWLKDGEMWSTLPIMVSQAPPNFDKMTPLWRHKFRSGTISVGYESVLTGLSSSAQNNEVAMYAMYQNFQQQCEAEKAARARAEQQRQLVESGQYCQFCLLNGRPPEQCRHTLEQCPYLHPGATNGTRPPAVPAPAPSPAPPVQSLVPPAPPASNPGGSQTPTPTQQGAAPPPSEPHRALAPRAAVQPQTSANFGTALPPPAIQFFNAGQPVSGSVTIAYAQRGQGQFVVQVNPDGGALYYRIQFPNGRFWPENDWRKAKSACSQFDFTSFGPGSYTFQAYGQSPSGAWSPIQQIQVNIR